MGNDEAATNAETILQLVEEAHKLLQDIRKQAIELKEKYGGSDSSET